MTEEVSIPDQEAIQKAVEEEIQKCLETVRGALGMITNSRSPLEPSPLEPRELKGEPEPEKDMAVTASGDTLDKRKNDLAVVRDMAQHRCAEAKTMFLENQARFAESRAKFLRCRANHLR